MKRQYYVNLNVFVIQNVFTNLFKRTHVEKAKQLEIEINEKIKKQYKEALALSKMRLKFLITCAVIALAVIACEKEEISVEKPKNDVNLQNLGKDDLMAPQEAGTAVIRYRDVP